MPGEQGEWRILGGSDVTRGPGSGAVAQGTLLTATPSSARKQREGVGRHSRRENPCFIMAILVSNGSILLQWNIFQL